MMLNVIKLPKSNIQFGDGCPPFVIAEMSGNHNQSLDRALKIVKAAAKAGCHALKLQTYTAETMTINHENPEFFIDDKKSLWSGRSLFDLYKEAYTPWEWHEPIFSRCRELGMVGFSTPFDVSAVDFLEKLEVPFYKIASFENVDLPLIEKVAKTGKPVIMSTGMANSEELWDAVNTIRATGNQQICLLKCTSSYPCDASDSNLSTIPHMKREFSVLVGVSDHTLGIGVSVAAVALGACVIERHFTLSRSEGGVDAAFSLEPIEMKSLVEESHKAFLSLGSVCYAPTESEQSSIRFRRSIYVVRDINPGDMFDRENLRIIRPGYGLKPKYLAQILGKKAKKKIARGTAMSWDLVE